MKLRSVLLSLFVLAACFAHALAQTYSAIYVFGDSYCDTGNLWIATGGSLPAPPYYEGRFSNGPLWVEQLAAARHTSVQPWFAGGTNYAIAGSQLLQSSAIPSIPIEVNTYLFLNGGVADPNALYILEGGTNDVLLSSDTVSPVQLGYSIAAAQSALQAELSVAGARHFLVLNVPDVALLPAAQPRAAFAAQAVSTANAALAQLIGSESFLQGNQVPIVDFFSFTQSLLTDPAQAGFASGTTPCLTASDQVCADPSSAVLWDTVHMTTSANALLATTAEAALNNR